MRLYHGSIQTVEKPDLSFCRKNTDFGQGFYTTTNKIQAEQWCTIIQKRNDNTAQKIVSAFEFDHDILKVRNFDGVSEDWLDFIFANRYGAKTDFFDIVLGPVANDSLYATLQIFEQGVITKQQAIARLKSYTLVDQISFHSDKALETLQFVESYVVK